MYRNRWFVSQTSPYHAPTQSMHRFRPCPTFVETPLQYIPSEKLWNIPCLSRDLLDHPQDTDREGSQPCNSRDEQDRAQRLLPSTQI